MAEDQRAIEQWKQKYFDQLERLEQKEANWGQLETTLNRAIGRLSIAAEGQHDGLDKHIVNLRRTIKKNASHRQLEPIIDDISAILAQLEANNASPDRVVTDALLELVTHLSVPDSQQKACKKIIKKLEKANDSQRDVLLVDTTRFLSASITAAPGHAGEKPTLLSRVFSSTSSEVDSSSEGVRGSLDDEPLSAEQQCVEDVDVSELGAIVHGFLRRLPWPEAEKASTDTELAAIESAKTIDQLQSAIHRLTDLTPQWASTETVGAQVTRLAIYKDCLLDLIDALEEGETDNDFSAVKNRVQLACEDDALRILSSQLSSMLLGAPGNHEEGQTQGLNLPEQGVSQSAMASDASLQPTIQELLIRLLEQLIVPKSLAEEVEQLKQNLENKTNPGDWTRLLKDVANLINSIRLSMQAEKHEFEGFLQQVTDRLKDMDLFLQTETTKIQSAQSDGKQFDQDMQSNVNTIRDDVNQATELPELKALVDKKLEVISEHINAYRVAEQKRAQETQNDVQSMHLRMQELEKEAESLNKVIVEKNQQAMFDALTAVPNRLYYEQKIEEEFIRWQGSGFPLTLAVWDIDFFKKINDNYGHKAGDKVLATVAQLLNKRIRKNDFFARYGGEEFVMLLPESTGPEALKLADVLRESIKNCSFHYGGEDVCITASCGISSFRPGDTRDQVFERADKALYEAKESGRNRCVLAS